MVHATSGFEPAPGDALTVRSSELFVEVVELLLSRGVSVVAEAAFQHDRWTGIIGRLDRLASTVVVQCRTDTALALERVASRGIRPAHADAQFLATATPADVTKFTRLATAGPSIDVDTTAGYVPPIAEIVAFIGRHAGENAES